MSTRLPDVLDHAAIITTEAEALAAAADGADGTAPVPGTDWTLDDLLDHVGQLMWLFAGRTRKALGGEFYDTERPEGADRVAWFREGAVTLSGHLAEAPDDLLIKTWAGPSSPAWLRRRVAHELTVHRWDAEAATGTPTAVAADVAADGIDELLDEFLALVDLGGVGGTLHLHATDGDGEWLIDPTGDTVTWRHGHEKGDVAVRGATGDLLLVLWGRLPPSRVEVLGDDAVLDRWLAATSF